MTAQRTCAAPAGAPPSDAAGSDAAILHAALAGLPEFAHPDRVVERLPGGLTNRIYKVTGARGRSAVARVSSSKSELLAIDRLAECHNARAAASIGAGPDVLVCDPAAGVSVVEWIAGHTFTDDDLDDAEQLARVAQNCRRLHAADRFANDFDMFDLQRRYLEVVQRSGFRLPPRYLEFAPAVEAIRTAIAAHPRATVPCHNDLLAANIMDDGERIWFIDYEYAGNNDACFELGNIWSEANLPLDRLPELVHAYFGTASPSLVARARLWALMSKYGWTLWASIQDGVSDVDFDFWTWGMEKFDRAVAEFDGPDFAQLIDDLHQPN